MFQYRSNDHITRFLHLHDLDVEIIQKHFTVNFFLPPLPAQISKKIYKDLPSLAINLAVDIGKKPFNWSPLP